MKLVMLKHELVMCNFYVYSKALTDIVDFGHM